MLQIITLPSVVLKFANEDGETEVQ